MYGKIIDDISTLLCSVGTWLKEHGEEQSMRDILKKDSRNITFRVDWEAEENILNGLEKLGLNAIVITEERNSVKIGKNKPEWYIFLDPLDGSKNFINGIQYSAITLAMAKYKKQIYFSDLVIGFVHDIWNGKTYHATKYASIKRHIPSNPIIVGYMTGPAFNIFRHYKKLGYNVRTFGSAALDLLQVAFGKAEAFFDPISKMRVFDIAGAYVILRNMGGLVLDAKGEDYEKKLIIDGESVNITLDSVLAFNSEESARQYFREMEKLKLPEEYILRPGESIKRGDAVISFDGTYIMIETSGKIQHISPGQSIRQRDTVIKSYVLTNKVTAIEVEKIV